MHLRRSLRLSALLLVVLVAGVVPSFGAAPSVRFSAVAPVEAQDAPHTATIRAAFTLLMDQFYKVPDPMALLSAAWDGATMALQDAGYSGQVPALPALPADREGAFNAFAAAYPGLAALAPSKLSQEDLAFFAIDSMTTSVNEQHTYFLSPKDYASDTSQLSGDQQSIGLGVEFAASPPPFLITDVAPGGPADQAGAKPGDTIVKAGQRDVSASTVAQVAEALGGPAGTVVQLVVDRPGQGQVSLAITRGPYQFPDFTAKLLPDGTGYVRLRIFSSFVRSPDGRQNVIQQLDAALARFSADPGFRNLVVDLRGNRGGYVFTNDELIGRFLPNVIAIVNANQRGDSGQEVSASRPAPFQPAMAVLIDKGSASSSEAFAVAMQEYGRAVIVGQQSIGALATGITFPLPDGAALNIGVASVRSGRLGVTVDEVGVAPDLVVADNRTAADYAAGRDPQLAAAIAAAKAAPTPAPAPASPFSGQLSDAAIGDLLSRYMPAPEEVAPAPLIPAPRWLGDFPVTDPVRFADGAEDTAALATHVQARGWLGEYNRIYGGDAGLNGPTLGVSIDVYSTVSGAIDALNSNDFPRLLRSAAPPVQLGDGTVAYIGTWLGAGGANLSWRAGNAVITVSYSAVPGEESFDPAVALARVVDARLQQSPIALPVAVPASVAVQTAR